MAEPIVEEVQENLNISSVNGTGKVPSTPEGMALAYGSLVIMALVPIVIGSFRSVRHHKEQKVSLKFLLGAFFHCCQVFYNFSCNRTHLPIFAVFVTNLFSQLFQESGEKPDTMTTKDAAMFPIIASCALFGLYVFFKVSNNNVYSQNFNHPQNYF